MAVTQKVNQVWIETAYPSGLNLSYCTTWSRTFPYCLIKFKIPLKKKKLRRKYKFSCNFDENSTLYIIYYDHKVQTWDSRVTTVLKNIQNKTLASTGIVKEYVHAYRDACHSYGSIVIFWFCRHLDRSCWLSVIGAWSSYVKEFFLLSNAWWSLFAFFRCAKVAPGDKEVDPLFGSSEGGACRTSAGLRQWQCPYSWLGLIFFVRCVCVYIHLFLYIVCLCIVQFLLKFLL
jgi:hypothetical protein